MLFAPSQKIVLASNNQGKINEIQAIMHKQIIVKQSDYCVPEVEETGSTFVENAIIKARHAAQHCNLPALADDSGLVVDALDGVPGVYSARYAGKGASDAENNAALLAAMANIPEKERSARFICVLVLMRHGQDPTPIIAQGMWEGGILCESRGAHGFGYDPLFWVPEYHCTSAELTFEVKNALSHRGQALRQLAELLV